MKIYTSPGTTCTNVSENMQHPPVHKPKAKQFALTPDLRPLQGNFQNELLKICPRVALVTADYEIKVLEHLEEKVLEVQGVNRIGNTVEGCSTSQHLLSA